MNVPAADEVTTTWWDATREQRLLVQECGCGHLQHPPRALCTACGSTTGLDHREVTGAGVVDSCTVVERAMPGFDPPYVVARVRLAEGLLLLANVESDDPHGVRIDDPVALAWRPLDDGRALPIFRPAPEETA